MKPVFNFKIGAIHKNKPIKKKEETKISRLCLATIIIDNNTYKAKINTYNDSDYPDYIVINLSKDSYNLNNKRKIYSKEKDEHNQYVLYLRDSASLNLWHPDPNKFSSVCENLCVSGNIIRVKGELQFQIKDSHCFANNPQDLPTNIDTSKPLFK